jgi:ABC-type dipeptide/oligopeptide/nickel transport system permease component
MDRDLQTPTGLIFLSFILTAGISFPIIGYLCVTSTACVPYSGEVLLYIGCIIDVFVAGMLLLYIIRVITYSCVDPLPPLTTPPAHAYKPYRRRVQSV